MDPPHTNWTFYDVGYLTDSPEGSYMGWLYNTTSNIEGTVTLPKNLNSGRYYIFLKGIAYDSFLNLKISMGGAQSQFVTADDRDETGYWSSMGYLDIPSATNQFKITVSKTRNLTANQRYLFRGIYLTTNPNEVVTSKDVVLDMSVQTGTNPNPAIKGNQIFNSSFEAGVDAGWGVYSSNTIDTVKSKWDSATGFHGQSSLKLKAQDNGSIVSRLFHLKPNTTYTFSAWVKSSQKMLNNTVLRLANTHDPIGTSLPFAASAGKIIDTTWQRLSLTTLVPAGPSMDYNLYIFPGETRDAFVWVDAVQLEEGQLTDYRPAYPLEAGIMIDKPGHIYYENEPITARLFTYNDTDTTVDRVISFRMFDIRNNIVKQGSLSGSFETRRRKEIPIDLNVGLRGFFRIVLDADPPYRSENEIMYSVIPPITNTGLDGTSSLGIHPNYVDYQLDILRRMGMKWSRVLSPSWFFRWSVVEPSNDQYVWYDSEVQKSLTYGINTLGTLGTNNYWPAWADAGGTPNLDAWEDFVSDMVAHYKPWVRAWEVWNEPHESGFSYAFYAQMLKRAADAIRRNDPTATVVGMGGTSVEYMTGVIKELELQFPNWDWKANIDVLSTHIYPTGYNSEPFKSQVIDVYQKPVWNTETGYWCLGAFQGINSNFTQIGMSLWPFTESSRFYLGLYVAPIAVVKNFIESLGVGISKYFYYDSRTAASPDFEKTHPTLLEYDGSVRPKGIAYAIAGTFLDHSKALGLLSLGTGVKAYLFEKAGHPIMVGWTTDNSMKSIQISLPNSSVEVRDIMGNLVSRGNGQIPLGYSPVYITGIGISSVQLKQSVEQGIVTVVADTIPPTITITDAPADIVTGNSFRIRWLAMDNVSVPSAASPDAIRYSYRLIGNSDWSAWNGNTLMTYADLPKGTYRFEVKARDQAGNESATINRTIQLAASVDDGWPKLPPPTPHPVTTPTPNPFSGSPSGEIKRGAVFNPTRGEVTAVGSFFKEVPSRIEIYDRRGALIKTINQADSSSTWDGRNESGQFVASGVYLVVSKAKDVLQTKKVVVVK